MQAFTRALHSVAATLFAVLLVTYAYFYPGGGHNEAARYDTIRALLRDHTFAVDRYAYNSADLIRIGGHYYSSKAPGTTLLGLPFFWASERVLSLVPTTESARDHWTCYLTSLFTIALPCALGMVVLYRLLLRLRAAPREAALVTLAVGLGSIYFPFATLFFSHAVTAALVLTGFYQVFSFQNERWRLATAGLALGTAILFEFPAAIAVGLVGLYAIWKLWRTGAALDRWLILPASTIAALVPLLVQNWLAFGDPLFISYEAYAQSSSALFEAHKHGALGVSIPLLDLDDWALFLHNLAEITYRPLRGLFVFNPVLLLSLAGFALLARRLLRREYPFPAEAILALASFGAYLAFNAGFGDSIVYWGGGASFGPRHLIPMLPFLGLPLLEALRNPRLQAAFVPLLLVSVFFCTMAIAVEPRTPYEPRNPLFDYYLPKYLSGDLAITSTGIFSNDDLTLNSVAFNWGKLAGLPGRVQLLPLFLLWIVAARHLDRLLGIGSRGFLYATAILVGVLALSPIMAAPG